MSYADYRTILNEELKKRQLRNPSYSTSAFARDLGTSSQKLNQVLRGVSGLSPEAATAVAQKLELAPSVRELFIALAGQAHARGERTREHYKTRVRELTLLQEAIQKNPNEFDVLSDALSWTLFLLVETVGFSAKPETLQARTGAPAGECALSWSRLHQSGLVVQQDDGTWKQNEELIQFSFERSDDRVRRFYAEMLERAQLAVHAKPFSDRYNHVIMMPMNEKTFEEIKAKIDRFAQDLLAETSAAMTGATRVYALAISHFPLDRRPDDVTTN